MATLIFLIFFITSSKRPGIILEQVEVKSLQMTQTEEYLALLFLVPSMPKPVEKKNHFCL